MESRKLSQSVLSTQEIPTKSALSAMKHVPITAVVSDPNWSGAVGGPLIQQPCSFERNLTNNP